MIGAASGTSQSNMAEHLTSQVAIHTLMDYKSLPMYSV